MNEGVRIFRKNPIAWWDKNVMRYLRRKYGQDKRQFISLRSVYLALCEIESDFVDTPIRSFTKTVGTYAGVSRGVAGKCINLLQAEKLISRVQLRDPKTNKFSLGTLIEMLALPQEEVASTASEPLSRIPDSGDGRQRGSPTPLRKIINDKKIKIDKNVYEKDSQKKAGKDKVNYYAELLAQKLNDKKSLPFYRLMCRKYDPHMLLRKAAAIMADGGAKKPGAVFVYWIQQLSN